MDAKIKEAWQRHKPRDLEMGCRFCIMCNAYLDAEARARRAEFWNEHRSDGLIGDCVECGSYGLDEHHKWDLAQWRKSVVRELEG